MTAGAALLLVAAGWWYVLFVPAPPGRHQPAMPAMNVETGPGGAPAARIDHESLRRACGALGLPDPPDFNGADPVPVRNLLDRENIVAVRRDTGTPEATAEIIDRMAEEAYAANPQPIPYESPRYRASADLDGDGFIAGRNELFPLYTAAARDVTQPVFFYGPPRLVRLGVEVIF